ncbi:restriction endonuclease [Jonesia denitrificans]|uniref:Restriction endonuclease n=2 Tax=Jonesia TaxID=43673 RepID=C7R5K6_JONDD|nr:restriction endonuclease [Jonesia denitrificans DSM 20603]ASE10151.1 restriction endonuclease [Jonesia denitrificans]QXB44501.1 restriction endonuclease [Jonesia denitrificans]SQH21520.1 Restriction endonuclease [Jonesia denitrificans]
MKPEPTIWGVHNDTLTEEIIAGGFISAGWDKLGDLNNIPDGREGFKNELAKHYPERKPLAIAGWAGILTRLRDTMQPGDIVVAPYKPDSTINIGIITGDYYYATNETTHRHRRPVRWEKIGLSRTVFTQPALYEVGSFLTIFRVRKHADEFLAALHTTEHAVDAVTNIVEHAAREETDEENTDEPRASRIERHTRDHVLEALHKNLTHQEFEEFTADLLRALGYQARVTQYNQDGGVDVIAHRDPLGVEPPQIKVQCKHLTSTIGAPDVQQLIGTQGPGDYVVFVTLGNYSRDAISIERQRSGLRLLTGEDVVTLFLDHYAQLPERWRTRIPLTPLLVVADNADL